MRFLVVGGSGYLGGEVVRQALRAGHEVVATFGRAAGDAPGAEWRRVELREPGPVAALVRERRPDVVVNCAYRKDDWAVTADGAARVAVAAAAGGAGLVQVSSDLVFPGTAAAVVFAEDAPPAPDSPYGAAKAAAETAVRAVHPAAAVVRTSLILGDGRSVHEEFARELATGRRPGGVLFTDVVRCPVHVADLAAALLEVGTRGLGGVLHVTGPEAVSRAELGRLIAAREGLNPDALPTGPAPGGPSDIRLDCARTARQLRTRLRGAREFLAATPT
ncbi:SDR family oxidoreductase [Streptacidiphilus monticola]|uniref:SDR family oxidoreductase n=1 Tax=Streptacidiphilus monticola TaxID=2161674 RepID=A0ABW1G5L2_9ACTN